jgi:hypothetical protein
MSSYKLYTNIMPFCLEWDKDNKPKFIEAGTTFALIGAGHTGLMVKLVRDINTSTSRNLEDPQCIIPDVFNAVFKEVEILG